MAPFAEPAVDWGALLEVVWSSLLGGIGVTAVFALAILGTSRAEHHRRDGRMVIASGYGLLGVLAFVGVLAAVVFGIVVMTQK